MRDPIMARYEPEAKETRRKWIDQRGCAARPRGNRSQEEEECHRTRVVNGRESVE